MSLGLPYLLAVLPYHAFRWVRRAWEVGEGVARLRWPLVSVPHQCARGAREWHAETSSALPPPLPRRRYWRAAKGRDDGEERLPLVPAGATSGHGAGCYLVGGQRG